MTYRIKSFAKVQKYHVGLAYIVYVISESVRHLSVLWNRKQFSFKPMLIAIFNILFFISKLFMACKGAIFSKVFHIVLVIKNWTVICTLIPVTCFIYRYYFGSLPMNRKWSQTKRSVKNNSQISINQLSASIRKTLSIESGPEHFWLSIWFKSMNIPGSVKIMLTMS